MDRLVFLTAVLGLLGLGLVTDNGESRVVDPSEAFDVTVSAKKKDQQNTQINIYKKAKRATKKENDEQHRCTGKVRGFLT